MTCPVCQGSGWVTDARAPHRLDSLTGTVIMAGAEFVLLRSERDTARQALMVYGGHTVRCVAYGTGAHVGCTCGWVEVLRLLPRMQEAG